MAAVALSMCRCNATHYAHLQCQRVSPQVGQIIPKHNKQKENAMGGGVDGCAFTHACSHQRLLHDAYASHVVLCALATSHRNVSLVNFGLVRSLPATPEYNSLTPPTVEVIGDGLHVDPLTISALLAARETRDVAFITGAAASRLV